MCYKVVNKKNLSLILFLLINTFTYGNDISPTLDWNAVPDEFRAQLKDHGIMINVRYQDEDLGNYFIEIIDEKTIKFKDLKTLSKKLQLKPIIYHIFETLPINQIILCPDELISKGLCHKSEQILYAQFSLESLTMNLTINKKLFETQKTNQLQYLQSPSNQYLSSIFKYNLNAATTISPNTSNVASLALNNITSYGNTRLLTNGYFSTSNQVNIKANLSQLLVLHDFKKSALSFGFSQGNSVFSSRNTATNYGYSGNSIALSFYSSNNLLLNKSQGSLIPIILFIPRQSNVRVYKDNNLLSIQNFELGTHELNTANFPGGVYPVRIEIREGDILVNTLTKIINKPFDLSTLDPDLGFSYSLWGGVASSPTYNEPVTVDSFNHLYFGGNINFVLNRYMLSGASAYMIGRLSVFEFSNQLMLPYGITGNANIGVDTDGGIALSANLNKSFYNILSIGASYTQQQGSNEKSPFYISNNNLSISLSLNMQSFGSLSSNINYNFKNHLKNYNFIYSNTLFKRHGFTLRTNASLLLNENHNSSLSKFNTNYYIGLELTYNFDENGSINLDTLYNPKDKLISSNINYSPNIDDNLIISDMNIGGSYNQNSSMINASTSFNSNYALGNINTNITQNNENSTTQVISGNLSGSLVIDQERSLLPNQQKSNAGAVIYLDNDIEDTLSININGTSYPITTGTNFIPLPPYKKYESYISINKETKNSLLLDTNINEFILYPGNVFSITHTAIHIIIISGQLICNGEPLKHVKVSNSINSTYSDDNGYFTLGVNRNNPNFNFVSQHQNKPHEFSLSQIQTSKLYDGYWLGEINCSHQNAGDYDVIQ
ncbi:TcfC E-set like domain-containing protein [Cysteiniphilum sp. QT6929]|uniref:TcfC E-set like domain-containing protein n=1 Tax=Cysteiniphilum sp. QT6929 TaxID=2975055 RepID=UPI0024B3C1A7|nr:TcfC E-set like domain-containing protein [Cysteiniphilum sp. QT6929]WHN66471.1 TcfC E-set like domain-containing protein [Cysteiniphilum sp. QT6929]